MYPPPQLSTSFAKELIVFNVVSGFHPALNSICDHSTTCSVRSLSILIGIAIFPPNLRLTYDLLTTNCMIDCINCQYYPTSKPKYN